MIEKALIYTMNALKKSSELWHTSVNCKARPVVEGEHDKSWNDHGSTLRSILLVLFLMFEYFIHMSMYQNCFQPILLWHFFYFSFCLLLYCMVLYLDALVGGCYCQKWPSKNVNSYNWLLVVIKGLFIGFDFWTTDFSM